MSLLDAFLLEPYQFQLFLAKRLDGQKGSGTVTDPLNAASATVFDSIMNNVVQEGTVVHLGPGEYETRGYDPANSTYGWKIKPKTKIVGSGMGITTLKLVTVSPQTTGNYDLFVIGHDLSGTSGAIRADFAEISELTINPNADQIGTTTCRRSGIRIMGSHVTQLPV